MVDRIQRILEVSKRDPSLSTKIDRTDLDQALANQSVDQDKIDWAWKAITTHGYWDAANKAESKLMTEAAGAWRTTTKESFGTEKAKNYIPKGWEEDLSTATQQGLQEAIFAATRQIENAAANQAVGVAEAARSNQIATGEMPDILAAEQVLADAQNVNAVEINALRSSLTELQKEPGNVIEARETMEEAKRRIRELQSQIDTMLAGAPKIDGKCPGCEIPITIHFRKHGDSSGLDGYNKLGEYALSHPAGTQVNQMQVDAHNKDIALMQTKVSERTDIINRHAKHAADRKAVSQNDLEGKRVEQRQACLMAETRLTNAKQKACKIKTAQAQLANITGKGEEVSSDIIAELHQAYEHAETRMRAWLAKTNADRYTEEARKFAVLKDVTSPNGLRKTIMGNDLPYEMLISIALGPDQRPMFGKVSDTHWVNNNLTQVKLLCDILQTDFKSLGIRTRWRIQALIIVWANRFEKSMPLHRITNFYNQFQNKKARLYNQKAEIMIKAHISDIYAVFCLNGGKKCPTQ